MTELREQLHQRAGRGVPRGPAVVLGAARVAAETVEAPRPFAGGRGLILAGVVAAVALVLTISLYEPESNDAFVTDGPPATASPPTTPSTTAPLTTTTAIPTDLPETLVASTLSGFVRVDSRTGAVVQELGEGGDGATTPAPLPDGGVIVERVIHGCDDELVRIPACGGSSQELGGGRTPAVTADGRRLAYALPGPCVPDAGPGALVVEELASGRERWWELPSWALVGTLSWSADGEALVVELMSYEPLRTEIRLLDLVRDDTFDDARVLAPAEPGVTWRLPAFRGAYGTVAVVESPTETDATVAPRPSRIVSVDPQSGEVLASLVLVDRSIVSLDADATGRHLLWVEIEPKVDGVRGPAGLPVPLER